MAVLSASVCQNLRRKIATSRMNTPKFLAQLRSIADELAPLTISASSGSAVWDGTKYAKSGPRTANPSAMVWRSLLTAIAELVEGQGAPITPRQRDYLQRLLFGGMGSLNDLGFGQPGLDRALDEKRQLLFAYFNE